MGAPVTVNALLALGNKIRGASIWSGSLADFSSRAAMHSAAAAIAANSSANVTGSIEAVLQEFSQQSPALTPGQAYFGNYLALLQTPLNIHHASGDQATSFLGSIQLAIKLERLSKPYRLYAYKGGEHLFKGADFQRAISRDVLLFQDLMQQ